MALANAVSAGRAFLAPVASAAGRLPVGSPTGSRTANLAQAPGHSAGGLPRGGLLPRATAAAVHARRSGVGVDLPALRRHLRALRRDSSGASGRGPLVGAEVFTAARGGALGRRAAQEVPQLRRRA